MIQVAHTADVDPATLRAARALLGDVFEGEFEETDWEHSLGGLHALAWASDQLVGHAALIQRRLVHRGRALRTGYVEGVAVHPDHQRRGYGAAMMDELERVIRGAYDLGALGATDDGARLYEARGWQRWEGPTSALTPEGVARTEEDDGAVYVLPVTTELDVTGELTCDWRDGDVW
jgi:aminoglycoside 2'-N-acetyltransferase I